MKHTTGSTQENLFGAHADDIAATYRERPPQVRSSELRSPPFRSSEARAAEHRASEPRASRSTTSTMPHGAATSVSPSPSPSIVSGSSLGPGVSRDEMNLAEFPLTVLSTRVDPKIKTLEFSDFQKGKDGELTERKWIITGADKFGLPTATDDDVILGLIRLTMDDGFRSRKVYFTRYELLRALQWSTEGRSYTRLVKSLDRLSGVRIRASNAFYDNSSKSYQTKNFGIIDAYELNDHRAVRKRPARRPAAREATPETDEDSGKSFFLWSEMLFNSFRSGFIKKLDLDLYFSLRSSVARRLYRYLDKHFYFRPVVERPLMFLAFEKLGISRNYKYVSSVKQQLEPAAEELLAAGYLSSFEFNGRGEGATVRFHAARDGAKPLRGQVEVLNENGTRFARGGSEQAPSPGGAANRHGSGYSSDEAEGSLGAGFSKHGGNTFSETPDRPRSVAHGSVAHAAPDQDAIGHRRSARSESFTQARGADETAKLRSQLIEALVSRGIALQQAKRLLFEKEAQDLRRVDQIIGYYDHLVETGDSKISRNKVGFLYRAVETPVRFQVPQSFLDTYASGSLADGATLYQSGGPTGSGATMGPSFRSVPSSPGAPFAAGRRDSKSGAAGRDANDAGLRQARLRQAYYEFVSAEVAKEMQRMAEREREELRRKVEEKMSCLGTALSPERFEEAVQGCMREEIVRLCSLPDFRRWSEMQEREAEPRVSR